MKTALLIAAGSGMGSDAAKKLAADGYNISIMSSSGKGEKLAKELNGIGLTGSNLNVDDIKKIIDLTILKFGRIDVLVNSAGHGPKGNILEITDENWIKGMEYYLLNVIRAVRLVTPHMIKQKNGSIINISTFAAYEPDSLFPTSGVFRSGLGSFTKLYANEYGKYNIRMNNILPGFIDSLPETEERKARIPMQRYGKVDEVSKTICFLASDGSSYINGQNIKVDGGLTKYIS